MTHPYQHYKATCDLQTKEVQPNIRLPPQAHPAPHIQITDPTLFVTTALARLESASPVLRGLAERALRAFLKLL